MFVCVCVRAYVRVLLHGSVGVSMSVRVVLLIQHAMYMRHIVTSFVFSQAQQHFSTQSHKRYDFRGKDIEYKMCVFILSTTFF
jgi:hypothetical protein